MNHLLLSSVVILAFFLNIAGMFSVIKTKSIPFREAYCYASVLVFAIYSVAIQIFFLLHVTEYFYIFEALFSICSLYQLYKLSLFTPWFTRNNFTYRPLTAVASLLSVGFILYVFLQAVLLPPYNWDSMTYHLPRIFMFLGEDSLFLKNFTHYPQTMYAWGYDVLSFLFLRFYSDYGLSLFNFICYTIIILGTYELVNQHFFDTSLSLKTSIIIASLPGIILQATSTKNDLPGAALCIVCFLAANNFYRRQNYFYLYMVIVSLLFGLSVKTVFGAFAALFTFFYAVFLVRTIPFEKIIKRVCLRKNIFSLLNIIPTGMLFCLMIFWFHNDNILDTYPGTPRSFIEGHINQDGLLGGIVNMSRYLLQAIDLPVQFGGNFLTVFHDNLWGTSKSLALRNSLFWPAQLTGNLKPDEMFSWYGPLGMLLIIPSIIYSACRARGLVRLLSFSLIAYALFFSYSFVWMPWNGRFFVTVFGGSGLCVAFFMHKIIKKKYLSALILLIALSTLTYSALFNVHKPFFTLRGLDLFAKKITVNRSASTSQIIPSKRLPPPLWLAFVADRNKYYNGHFTDKAILNAFMYSIEPCKRILFLGAADSWLFPFFINRPDLKITVTRPDFIFSQDRYYDINKKLDYEHVREMFDYMICSEIPINSFIEMEDQIAYIARTELYNIPIRLYKLHHISQK